MIRPFTMIAFLILLVCAANQAIVAKPTVAPTLTVTATATAARTPQASAMAQHDQGFWERTLRGAFKPIGFVVLALILILAVYFFASWFTGDASQARRERWIIYSYAFTLLFVCGTVVGSLVYNAINPDGPGVVGITRGCALNGSESQVSCWNSNTPSDANLTAQWVVHIGGWVPSGEWEKGPPYKVRGGLVIPAYVVVLSLMGAAISLVRRIPEIQKRSDDPGYVGTEDQPKLSLGETREHLVFQIMQFVSAPLIAITAYYLVSPESRTVTVSVMLGFASGFSSEAVLLLIRGAVEKISPATTAGVQTGAAAGNVRRDGQGAEKAKVAVVGQPTLVTQTDASGAFVLNGVPIGDQVIEAGDPPATRLVKVLIEAGKATSCEIAL